MPTTTGDSVDLVAVGLKHRPVSEPSASGSSHDALLAAAARDGDRVAFGRLYERYARMVHGILLARVPVGEVDDIVQDVFIRALRRLSTLRETASFPAWLAAIARNLAHDYRRRSLSAHPFTEHAPGEDITSRIVTTECNASATAILDAVKSLPDAYRETLILRLVEGMTGPEIAARTGMTHGSVRVNLHRGMEQLRAKLYAKLRATRETP
jgi:RNA polymerase sigma-70 factor (ECF subfamily)